MIGAFAIFLGALLLGLLLENLYKRPAPPRPKRENPWRVGVTDWMRFAFAFIKATNAQRVAEDIVSVQPMSGRPGRIRYHDIVEEEIIAQGAKVDVALWRIETQAKRRLLREAAQRRGA